MTRAEAAAGLSTSEPPAAVREAAQAFFGGLAYAIIDEVMGSKLCLCRFLIGCLWSTLPAAAQLDSSALRAKYGSPLNRETFRMPSGFELIVDYGTNQQVCRLELPALMPSNEKVANAADMKRRMYAFLAQLVPTAMRGQEIRAGAMVNGMISDVFTEYEHVTVSEMQHADQPFSNNNTITVTFKNNDCQKPPGQ